MTPDDTAPLMQEDLTTCLACSEPAVAWRNGPDGAVGFCGSPTCEAEIAVRDRAAPAPRGCRVCSARDCDSPECRSTLLDHEIRLAPPIVVPVRDHGVCVACGQKAKVFRLAADSTLLRSCGGGICEAVIEHASKSPADRAETAS